ncbi:MAG: protoglobin domain-containing protein [Planctomycetota bacterium]|jgi:hypothetical protein
MGLGRKQLDGILDFVGFGREDEKNLEYIRSVITDDLEMIVERFYAHISRFESLRPFIEEERAMSRLRQTLRRYILTLGKDTRDLRYAEERLRIGHVHEHIGLGLRWYLGMYPLLFEAITSSLATRSKNTKPGRMRQLLVSLQRAITLDTVLVAETFYHATTRRLEDTLEQEHVSQENVSKEHVGQEQLYREARHRTMPSDADRPEDRSAPMSS